MQTIDVSVLITCYDKEEFLSDCVASVFRQTKLPKEVIIVHDGCKNPMHHIGCDSIFLKANYGVAHARDVAFKYSTGKLILFLDADDAIDPDYLEKMTLVIAKKHADIAYPDLFLWCGKDSKLTVTPNKIDLPFVKRFERVIIPVTSLMGRQVYERLGGFKQLDVLEDLDFFVRALKAGFVFKKAQTLLWYRRYGGTRNSISIDKRRRVLNEIMKQL
jgi:glycosyltransferase involved in cell wall biosynthesis